MPLGKVYPPARYPIAFHTALRQALAEPEVWHRVLRAESPLKARHLLIRLRAWAKSYEVYTLYDPEVTERLRTHRLRFRIGEGSPPWVRLCLREDPLQLLPDVMEASGVTLEK